MRKYIAFLLYGVVLVVNYLANALPINGKNTGELSDQYPNLFVPAGLTFSIWGVIYLLLLVQVAFLFSRKREATDQAVGWWLAVNFLCNAMWIFAWHYEWIELSLLIMIGLLLTLAMINRALSASTDTFARLTFGIYLGWICIATIANVTALLVSYSWHGAVFPETIWTILLIGVGAAVVVWLIRSLNNPFLALAVCWAFLGIVIKRQADYPAIAVAAGLALVVVAVAAVRLMRPRLHKQEVVV
jgi:hypothetical protein